MTMDRRPVSMELHHQITQFLYFEAEVLDEGRLREWVDELVDPGIAYQMIVTDERFNKDKNSAANREVLVYDDDHAALSMRVRQFESGFQTMNNPGQRLLRSITNIRAFHGEADGEFTVFSYGMVSRSRRLYENELTAYRRKDGIRQDADGRFRLASRRVDLIERVVRNKNLLFFL